MSQVGDDQEKRRTSQKSRYQVHGTGDNENKGVFEISSLEFGSVRFNELRIATHSNWVYPNVLIGLRGSRVYLTDYELCYVLTQYMAMRVSTSIKLENKSVMNKFFIDINTEVDTPTKT